MAISIGIAQFTLVFGINSTSNALNSMRRSQMLFRALQENQSTWLKHLEKHQEHRSGQFPWLKQWLVSSEVSVSDVSDTLHLKSMDKECTELAVFCVCSWQGRRQVF